ASPYQSPLTIFFFHAPSTPALYTLSLHDALPIFPGLVGPTDAVGLAETAIATLVQLIHGVEVFITGGHRGGAGAQQYQPHTAAQSTATDRTGDGIQPDIPFTQGPEGELAANQGRAIKQCTGGAVGHQYVGAAANAGTARHGRADGIAHGQAVFGADRQMAEGPAGLAEIDLTGAGLGRGFHYSDTDRTADRHATAAGTRYVHADARAVVGRYLGTATEHPGTRPGGRVQVRAQPGAGDALVVQGGQRTGDRHRTAG